MIDIRKSSANIKISLYMDKYKANEKGLSSCIIMLACKNGGNYVNGYLG
jgi:hypothetical protein